MAIHRGLDFRDLICPDGLAFKAEHFEMGDKVGRVLFLKDYASYIKDEMLLTIASMCPHTQEELARIHNLRKDIAGGRLGKEIIEVIKKFETIPENKYVTPPPYKTPAGSNSALLELLKLLLKIISQQEGVVARLIASDEDLKNFSTFENDDDNPILKGWRREIFGQKATELRNGKLSLRYNPKTRRIDL